MQSSKLTHTLSFGLDIHTGSGDDLQNGCIESRRIRNEPLAAGVYLLGSFLSGGADISGERAAAGLAFLTGLYVNLALEGLHEVGMRLYGLGGGQETDDE